MPASAPVDADEELCALGPLLEVGHAGLVHLHQLEARLLDLHHELRPVVRVSNAAKVTEFMFMLDINLRRKKKSASRMAGLSKINKFETKINARRSRAPLQTITKDGRKAWDAKIAREQKEAAEQWLDKTIATGGFSSAALLQQKTMLFEECTINDDGSSNCTGSSVFDFEADG